MTKQDLELYINLFKETEDDILKLDDMFGITIWNSTKPNFYNKYHHMLRLLLCSLFNEQQLEVLEDYIFEQTDMSFDDLCKALNIQ